MAKSHRSAKPTSFTERTYQRPSENYSLPKTPLLTPRSRKSSAIPGVNNESPVVAKKQVSVTLLRSPLIQSNLLYTPPPKQPLNYSYSKTEPKHSFSPINKSELSYKEHLFQTFQSMKFIKKLPEADFDQIEERSVLTKKKPGFEYKKTVVFDLDETLVHCPQRSVSEASAVVKVTFPNGDTVDAPINIRPFAVECLKEASKNYEVIVFTASHQCYADAVLNYLDPERKYIYLRLYRESCIQVDGVFVKDLRILKNRSLKDIILVDNAAHSFAYQIENGVPIISWYDDANDCELKNLIEYLQILTCVKDVREINRDVFKMHSFYEDYIEEYLKTRL